MDPQQLLAISSVGLSTNAASRFLTCGTRLRFIAVLLQTLIQARRTVKQVKKTAKQATSSSNSSNWYGEDRPKWLGALSPFLCAPHPYV